LVCRRNRLFKLRWSALAEFSYDLRSESAVMVSRQKLVEQAIRFGSPQRVPIVFWNRDQDEGDLMLYHLALGAPLGGFVGYVEEYGVMGMSAENYRACGEAFRRLNCGYGSRNVS
jgi:hypothetical protein